LAIDLYLVLFSSWASLLPVNDGADPLAFSLVRRHHLNGQVASRSLEHPEGLGIFVCLELAPISGEQPLQDHIGRQLRIICAKRNQAIASTVHIPD